MKAKTLKTMLGIGLSLSVLFSGSMILNPNSVYAATISSATSSKANSIIATGKQLMGTPYRFGAQAGEISTFDCSSFTQYVFSQNGITIPRSSKEQSQVGTYVPRSQLQPGDLVFFYNPIHHVAIYIGNGQILHTYGSGGVTISNLNSGWWDNHYQTARRVLPTSSNPVVTPAPTNPTVTPRPVVTPRPTATPRPTVPTTPTATPRPTVPSTPNVPTLPSGSDQPFPTDGNYQNFFDDLFYSYWS